MDYTLIVAIAKEAILKMHEIFEAIGYEDYNPVKTTIRPDGSIRVQRILLGTS